MAIEESELSWLVSEALVCPFFSRQIGWIGSKVTAMESIRICWHRFGMSSLFFILQVLDRRWKMPKLQVSDVRCKVKGCWCSMMFVGRFRADLQYYKVATMYPQSFRSLKEITTCFPCFFCFLLFLKSVQLVYKSSTLLQPFRCGKAFVKERALKRRSLAKALIAWFEQMWLGSDRLLSRLICFSDFAEDKGGNMIRN